MATKITKDYLLDLQTKLNEKNVEVKDLNKSLLEEMSKKLKGSDGSAIKGIQTKLDQTIKELDLLSKELLQSLNDVVSSDLSSEEVKEFSSIIEAARNLSDGTYTGTAPPSNYRD